MPVGSLLVSLLRDDGAASGRRRYPSASKQTLMRTNLGRYSSEGVKEDGERGRRRYPQSSRSTICFGSSATPPRTRQSMVHRNHPDQLGANLLPKKCNPPSPRHKVHVTPPVTVEKSPHPLVRRSNSTASRDHLDTGMVPRYEPPKKHLTPEPMILKRRSSGIRMFDVIPGEVKPEPRRALRKVSPPRSAHADSPTKASGRRRCASARNSNNVSHFTLAHSMENESAAVESSRRRFHRSQSADVIAWRGADSSAVESSARGRRFSATPLPRSYNIITNV